MNDKITFREYDGLSEIDVINNEGSSVARLIGIINRERLVFFPNDKSVDGLTAQAMGDIVRFLYELSRPKVSTQPRV